MVRKEEEEEEEEYEVQYINSHRIMHKGKDKKPKLEFEIKWRGYDSSENTWEPSESTEYAQDLVDQYWALKGGGAAERKKCERVLKGEKEESDSEKEEEEEDEEEEEEESEVEEYKEEKAVEKKAKHKKRTTTLAATTTANRSKRARIGELPSTSTKTTTTALKKKSKRAIVQRISDDESDESDVSDSEIEENNFRANSIHWTTDVDKILAVRPTGPTQELYATVRWRDGKIGLNKTALIAEKNPLLLIKFYEKRLAFESRPRK